MVIYQDLHVADYVVAVVVVEFYTVVSFDSFLQFERACTKEDKT